jgi:hypothetical protein
MSNDINDFLFASGAQSAKFEKIDDAVEGEIVSCDLRQQTDIETGTPLTFADGKPRMQLVVTLQTKLHESDDDDGLRTIYAKGGRYEVASGTGSSMRDAIAQAVKDVGADKIEEGATLVVVHTGLGKAKSRGFNQPKLYTAGYRKPKATVSAAALFSDDEA